MQYRIWKYRISLRLWEMDIGDITALSHFPPLWGNVVPTLYKWRNASNATQWLKIKTKTKQQRLFSDIISIANYRKASTLAFGAPAVAV